MMNLLHWRLVVAVAETGNITRAAEAYGITQSGASQAISQVEEMLGVKIFVREKRSTTLTAIGHQVIERAQRMLAELTSIQTLVNASRGCHLGRIRLASFPTVLSGVMPAYLKGFRRLHPGMEVVTLEGTDEEIEQWLTAGSIDLGVVMNPAPERNAVMLGRDRWVVTVPLNHPLARRPAYSPVELAEVACQPFILATGGCYLHGQTLAERAGVTLSDIRITVRDWSSAHALVKEGMGVSIVPESTLPDDLHGVRILNLAQPIYREFGLVSAGQGPNQVAAQALLRWLDKQVASTGAKAA
ncbi:LysR family transcriptional regulator [Nissabacter sp. SGAir0207]|uniref:LysR family transcriptional regulator n=1 Tax=Nissabacter sp. SGAir0207 TaxID=2126321 RepID=UPI0010CCFFA0|nr:LysR family transcriptional regulator [Nissabacter sp. SGAir0207]QCR35617.1 LysR family transcriptional regulator [Nissabacter sp. SGAir0207]